MNQQVREYGNYLNDLHARIEAATESAVDAARALERAISSYTSRHGDVDEGSFDSAAATSALNIGHDALNDAFHLVDRLRDATQVLE